MAEISLHLLRFQNALKNSKRWTRIEANQNLLEEIENTCAARSFISILMELEKYEPRQNTDEVFQINEIARSKGWDPRRFSIYGVTPGSTFKALFTEIIRQSFLDLTCCDDATFLVLGSSVGWIAFYAAFLFDFQVLGVEIVPYRVEIATELARQHGLEGKLGFLCQNAEDTDFSRARVVWDSIGFGTTPRSSILLKVSLEAPDDVVVITYEKIPEQLENVYEECLVVAAPNSWTPQQRYFIYRKITKIESKAKEVSTESASYKENWNMDSMVEMIADAHQSYRYPATKYSLKLNAVDLQDPDDDKARCAFINKMESMLGITSNISDFL